MNYDDLSIVVHDKQFLEEDSVPRDAKVINHTWRYVNKNGTPDRRFNNNRQIPTCLYEELWFNSPTGLNEVIQVSQTGIGRQLDNAIQHIADIVKQSAAIPLPQISPPPVISSHGQVAESIESNQQHGHATEGSGDRLFCVLLEVLCCLMAADGHASKSEKSELWNSWLKCDRHGQTRKLTSGCSPLLIESGEMDTDELLESPRRMSRSSNRSASRRSCYAV